MIPILGVTIADLDVWLGSQLGPMIGGNLLIAGLIILLVFLVMAMFFNLGIQATIVLGAFIVFGLTTGFIASSGGGSGLLPMGLLAGMGILFGFMIWRAIRGDIG